MEVDTTGRLTGLANDVFATGEVRHAVGRVNEETSRNNDHGGKSSSTWLTRSYVIEGKRRGNRQTGDFPT
jgi:hypothetical protein